MWWSAWSVTLCPRLESSVCQDYKALNCNSCNKMSGLGSTYPVVTMDAEEQRRIIMVLPFTSSYWPLWTRSHVIMGEQFTNTSYTYCSSSRTVVIIFVSTAPLINFRTSNLSAPESWTKAMAMWYCFTTATMLQLKLLYNNALEIQSRMLSFAVYELTGGSRAHTSEDKTSVEN